MIFINIFGLHLSYINLIVSKFKNLHYKYINVTKEIKDKSSPKVLISLSNVPLNLIH